VRSGAGGHEAQFLKAMFMARTKNNSKSGGRRANKKNQSTKPEEAAAWRLVRAMNGLPNDKYINPTSASLNTMTAINPGIVLLNGVATGTTENTRIGRLVTHKRLKLDFQIFYSGLYYQAQSYRAYVVVETTALGSQIAPSQLFVETTSFYPWTQRDFTNRNNSRYLVLHDTGPFALQALPRASGVAAPYGAAGLPPVRNHTIDIPLNFQTDYARGTAGTIADIDTNSLYFVLVTDNTNAGDLYMNFSYLTRFNDHEN
jgi:hypothetical protein